MPITNTRDIVPFVNQLEVKLKNIEEGISSWNQSKGQVLAAIPQVERNRVSSISAIVKAEDALSEINTATYGIVAAKGQRLRKLLDDLKKQVVLIAENAVGTGVPDYMNKEINNAISEVDSVVDDGLKLDYRLRKIQQIAQDGQDISNKDVIMPYRTIFDSRLTETTVVIEAEEGVEFVPGMVTILDANGQSGILSSSNTLITGIIDESGTVILSDVPMVPVRLYYPVRLRFKDVPEDFLMLLVETVIAKNSPIMETILKFEKLLGDILGDIAAMKGTDWTVDFSIMRNHKELVLEGITPKGLMVQVVDGIVHATWSYNEHPHLSHFIVERWNEEQKAWLPFDGEGGLVAK